MKILFFIITLVLYTTFVILAKKGHFPKILTPSPDMGIWSKIGYSLFGILVCYVCLRVISQYV